MQPRKIQTVVRQEVCSVPESREIEVSEHPYRVWTIYQEDLQMDTPPSLPMNPKHLDGVFMEDFLHDWRCISKEGKLTLTYYSRIVQQPRWILVEYSDNCSYIPFSK